ncbi:peptidoglycan-binding protein [Oceanicaulis alexandrii]|uniref:peptidoglycan-binding protein n=1 Tax=Oceanicaulis alexandrii TaxID=153233 RepID=UPI0023570FB8|nr:peptidoglycan-binding protein [Oceanicaulis alexandrii]
MPPVAPWSVKGIDPRARALAKSAARREGMTLGEWLNRVILDDGVSENARDWDDQLSRFPGFGGGDDGGPGHDDQLTELVQRLSDRMEASERRSTQALSHIDQSVTSISRRLDLIEDSVDEEGETAQDAIKRTRAQQDEILERVRRLERAGPGAGADPAALKSVETTVGKLAGRMYETERDVRAELDNLAHKEERRRDSAERGLEKLGQRLEESEKTLSGETRDLRELVETRDQRTQSLLSDLQDTSRSLQSRIISAEGATQRAAEALAGSQEKLDNRLRQLETVQSQAIKDEDVQRRIDALAREVADVIRETRSECARQIAEVSKNADGPRLERALAEAETRLRAAEQRQSDALQRIGGEVARMARAVEQRLDRTEQRLQRRLDEDEAKRQSKQDRSDLEARLEKVRQDNTVAMRRIGEQVARLGENLADRVQQAEHRSAEAVEAAGERMAQVVERLEHARSSNGEQDLETRIRASEERTAERIDKAMSGLHERLDQARHDTSEALSPVQKAMNALAERLEAIEGRKGKSKDKDPSKAVVREAVDAIDDFTKPLPEAPDNWVSNAEADDDFALPAHDDFDIKAEPARASSFTPAEPGPILAPTPKPQPAPQHRAPEPEPAPAARKPAAMGATADADFLAKARKQVRANRGGEAGWTPPAEPEQRSSNRTLLLGASALGFLAVAAAAGMLVMEAVNGPEQSALNSDPSATLSSLFSEPADLSTSATPDLRTAEADDGTVNALTETPAVSEAETAAPDIQPAPPPTQTPSVAAPAPRPSAAPAAPSLESAAANGDAVARYQLALQQLDEGRFSDAAALMRRAAEQDVPAAQRRFALMLANGEGVPANPASAREWMARAAENGNVQAMHDAGGMFINAESTPDFQAIAARWFEQGALHGLVDSQVNMALLFKEGFGVPESPADAYAWFTIAANAGDAEARNSAAELRPMLTPEQRAAAESVARNFTPRASRPEAQGEYPPQPWDNGALASPAQIARAQALLSQLGYQPGPADGMMGARTRDAIRSFRRAQGLTVSDQVDSTLISRLEQAAAG